MLLKHAKTVSLVSLLVLSLVGCQQQQSKEHLKVSFDVPYPLDLEPVSVVVLNDKNYQEAFDSRLKNGKPPVYVCMTPENYEKSSMNMQAIQNYLVRLLDIKDKQNEQ